MMTALVVGWILFGLAILAIAFFYRQSMQWKKKYNVWMDWGVEIRSLFLALCLDEMERVKCREVLDNYLKGINDLGVGKENWLKGIFDVVDSLVFRWASSESASISSSRTAGNPFGKSPFIRIITNRIGELHSESGL
jgi:hypothetical protein